MKFLAFVTCIVLSVGASFGLWKVLELGSRNSSEIRNSGDLDAVQAQYEVIEQSQVDLRVKIKRLEKAIEDLQATIESMAAKSADAESLMAEADGNDSEDPESGDDNQGDSEAGDEKPLTLDEAVELIADSELTFPEKAAIWKDLAKRGLMDEAVKYFEEVAADNPEDPHAQTALGHAYIHKLLNSNDLEKGLLAMKSDAAYDRALAVDDHHWEARFSKAMSYSYAPPVFGLQARAIEEFGILREQQEAQAPRDGFSQTYLLLGNLYANQGNTVRAQEVWKAGLEIFPDSQDLSKVVKPSDD
jgi:tetratricopeptide (TPR) repeat protein